MALVFSLGSGLRSFLPSTVYHPDTAYLDRIDPCSLADFSLSRSLQDTVYGCFLSPWAGVRGLTELLKRTKMFQDLDLAGGVLSA